MHSTPDADCTPTVAPDARTTDDEAQVAALDRSFQYAVKTHDVAAIDAILHRDYWLVLGDGTIVTRNELLDQARNRTIDYELQDEVPGSQQVRLWGDTAVVTAQLMIRGRREGRSFSRKLWFSDTYVRTLDGWKYAFAQASLPLPES